MKDTISSRIQRAMDIRNMKAVDICEKTGIPKSSMSMYLSGKVEPKSDRLYKIAKCLDVSEAWLLGYDVDMTRSVEQKELDELANLNERIKKEKDFRQLIMRISHLNPQQIESDLGIMPVATKRFPVLGDIACGKPIMANEEKELYVEAGTTIDADFCLRAKGDSMIGARIYDGDIVFIRKQEMVDNGDIAAVIIEDEASLKRVNYFPEKNLLILKAENAKYEDMVYTGEELNHIRILGRAVAFQSDIR